MNCILLIGNPFQGRHIDLYPKIPFGNSASPRLCTVPPLERAKYEISFLLSHRCEALLHPSRARREQDPTRGLPSEHPLRHSRRDFGSLETKGHPRIPLSLVVLELRLQSVDRMVSKHLHHEKEHKSLLPISRSVRSHDVVRMRATVFCAARRRRMSSFLLD